MSEQKDSLIGKFFHSFEKDGATVHNQGVIKSRISEGVYLVQLFSFVDGRATLSKVASIEDIAQWRLYNSAREMRAAHSNDDDFCLLGAVR